MERLKALLYCLRCHLVLLIFLGLAAGGYWLRADLYRHFGLAAGFGPESASVAVPSERALARVDDLPANPEPAGAEPRRVPVEGTQTMVAARLVAPQAPTAEELAEAGDFSFRPLGVASFEALSDLPNRQELLTQARRAYWNGDIRLALRSYERLIDAYPDQPDYPGELGNIYFEQGARQLAASFYLDSARLLLKRGERSRAEALAEILDALDAGSADELRRWLAGTGSAREPGGTLQAIPSPTL
jgi:tetratricopeptide (TPR) repeat protein